MKVEGQEYDCNSVTPSYQYHVVKNEISFIVFVIKLGNTKCNVEQPKIK